MDDEVNVNLTSPLLHSGFSVKHASLHVVLADATAARIARGMKVFITVGFENWGGTRLL